MLYIICKEHFNMLVLLCFNVLVAIEIV